MPEKKLLDDFAVELLSDIKKGVNGRRLRLYFPSLTDNKILFTFETSSIPPKPGPLWACVLIRKAALKKAMIYSVTHDIPAAADLLHPRTFFSPIIPLRHV